MIPHIEAVSRLDPQLLTSKEHGGGVGLAYRQGIGTDGDAAAGKLWQGCQQRLGEKARLVGDDAPGELFLVEPLDKIHHSLIGTGTDAEIGRVVVEQGIAQAGGPQLFKQFVAEARFQQPERPVGGGLTNDVVRERRKAFAYQYMVDGGPQIRGCVEQGAIQIEQHTAQGQRVRGAHQPCSGRTNSTI